jgi:serine/threonine-protein kinase
VGKVELSGTKTAEDAPELISLPPRASLAPGDVIGSRYEIRGRLGAGGMGAIYRVRDRQLHEDIALKMVLPERLESAGAIERLRREVKLARLIDHPNICRVFDFGEADGLHFLTMELIEGRTLRDLLAEEGVPFEMAIGILTQIAHGLAAAHAKGVVHRDLKPENVLVRADGHVKVVDFGIARRTEAASASSAFPSITVDGGIIGTPLYMSPEQIQGFALDGRTDQFSWGVLAYELLTGEPPWNSKALAVVSQILTETPAPIRSVLPSIPGAVEGIVLRALEKRPSDRFASMEEVAVALEIAAAGEKDPTKDSSERQAINVERPPARRARSWLRLGAIPVLAALGVAVALLLRGAPELKPKAEIAAPAPKPTAVIDQPVPISAIPEAMEAYRTGLQRLRVESSGPSDDFERALKLDPSLTAAHLKLAGACTYRINDSVRGHFRKAEEGRANLSERDQAMLDAMQPLVHRQPSDWPEAIRRLLTAIERFPRDAELWYTLGGWRMNQGEFGEALRAFERALEEDPNYTAVYPLKGWALAYLGRFDEARAELESCGGATVIGSDCAAYLFEVLTRLGACSAIEHRARQIIAEGKIPSVGYGNLAASLATHGKPVASIREAQTLALPPPSSPYRKQFELEAAIRLGAIGGDFNAAEQKARELMELALPSQRRDQRALPAWWLTEILTETGRTAEAGRVAMELFSRQDAWEPNPAAEDFAIGNDHTPGFLAAAQRAGLISREELISRRAAWLAEWERKALPFFRNYLWLQGYASIVETPEEAADALDNLPRYSPIPSYAPRKLYQTGIGAAHLMGGRVDEAVKYLEDATRTCHPLRLPFEHTRAFAWLGQAYEAKGDKDRACAAYRAVIDRWGSAKPGSVTAEKARKRISALKCPR